MTKLDQLKAKGVDLSLFDTNTIAKFALEEVVEDTVVVADEAVLDSIAPAYLAPIDQFVDCTVKAVLQSETGDVLSIGVVPVGAPEGFKPLWDNLPMNTTKIVSDRPWDGGEGPGWGGAENYRRSWAVLRLAGYVGKTVTVEGLTALIGKTVTARLVREAASTDQATGKSYPERIVAQLAAKPGRVLDEAKLAALPACPE